MRRVVFVGQTPPPYGGQSIMIEKILHGQYENVKLFHVRMCFSKGMDVIGKPSLFKVFHLVSVISQIIYLRFFKKAAILYYPPAGPDRVPILRDIVILVSTRWLFKKTIFHFHAGGVSQVRFKLNLLNFLFKRAYYYPDIAISSSDLNPPDGKTLYARHEMIVPLGIEDWIDKSIPIHHSNVSVKILFVGIIKESKGILILLEACSKLRDKGLKFRVEIMGEFESKQFETKVKTLIENSNLDEYVTFLGVLYGELKLKAFNRADIFCFPTFFESETFGIVILEAFCASLPVISTTWRAIPSIITDGDNGFLVEPKNVIQLAQKLEELIKNPELRKKIGEAGRKKYKSEYTLEIFYKRMEAVFHSSYI